MGRRTIILNSTSGVDTWDSSFIGSGLATVTLSNGNLTASCPVVLGNTCGTKSKVSHSTGKWYAEVTVITGSSPSGPCNGLVGVADSAYTGSGGPGISTHGWSFYSFSGGLSFKITNNTPVAYGNPYTIGDVISVAYDAGTGTLHFYLNGVLQTTDPPFTGLSGAMYLAVGSIQSGTTIFTANFGNQSWASVTSSIRTSLASSGYNIGW